MRDNLLVTLLFALAAGYAFLGGFVLINRQARKRLLLSIHFALTSVWLVAESLALGARDTAASEPWALTALVLRILLSSALFHHALDLAFPARHWARRLQMLAYALGLLLILQMPGMLSGSRFPPVGGVETLITWPAGWQSLWQLAYRAYLALTSFTALMLLFLHKGDGRSSIAGRYQAALLLLWALAYAHEVMLDFRALSLQGRLPAQMATTLLLLPFTFVLGLRRELGREALPPRQALPPDALILSDSGRNRVYLATSGAMILIALFNAFHGVSGDGTMDAGRLMLTVALPALALVVVSNLLFYFYVSRVRLWVQELCLSLTLNLLMAWLILTQASHGATTVWALSFLCLFVFSTFTYSGHILLVTLVHSAIQLYLTLSVPGQRLTVSAATSSTRVFIILLSVGLALLVNEIYTRRLRENAQQRKYHEAVAGISTLLNSSEPGEAEQRIKGTLKIIAAQLDIEPVHYFEITGDEIRCAHHGGAREDSGWESMDCLPLARELMGSGLLVRGAEPTLLPLESLRGKAPMTHAQLGEGGASWLYYALSETREKLSGLLLIPLGGPKKLPVSSEKSFVRFALSVLTGYSLRIHRQRQLMNLAYNDQLTGLYKRERFMALGAGKLFEAAPGGQIGYVMLLDIDSFKDINDSVGHIRGDEVLRELGARIREAMPPQDYVARFSGDEFLVMGLARDGEQAVALAESLMGRVRRPLAVGERQYSLTCSLGVALYPKNGQDMQELVKNADFAMFAAKRLGKNRYSLYLEEDRRAVFRTMEMSNALRLALEWDQLIVHYQMQVDLKTRRIIGAEALVRWQHPSLGMVSPGLFIPLAEEMGIIADIDLWVAKTASAQNKAWQDKGLSDFPISVNFSAPALGRPELVDEIKGILQETGLPPASFEIEVTESMAGGPVGKALNTLNRLRAMGITVAVDDFGIEYSTLGRISRIPFDRLKIDRSFVRPEDSAEGGPHVLLENIINLGRQMGVTMVAEGVETEEEAELLTRLGCQYGQGFHFHRPMPAGDATRLLSNLAAMRHQASKGGGMW